MAFIFLWRMNVQHMRLFISMEVVQKNCLNSQFKLAHAAVLTPWKRLMKSYIAAFLIFCVLIEPHSCFYTILKLHHFRKRHLFEKNVWISFFVPIKSLLRTFITMIFYLLTDLILKRSAVRLAVTLKANGIPKKATVCDICSGCKTYQYKFTTALWPY